MGATPSKTAPGSRQQADPRTRYGDYFRGGGNGYLPHAAEDASQLEQQHQGASPFANHDLNQFDGRSSYPSRVQAMLSQGPPWGIVGCVLIVALVLGAGMWSRWMGSSTTSHQEHGEHQKHDKVIVPPEHHKPKGYCSTPAELPNIPGDSKNASGVAEWVSQVVEKMTLQEKHTLVNGYGMLQPGFYVGNTLAVPRLGVPSLQLQDATQGVRTTDPRMVGQVTSWPCALAIAASWDSDATYRWAQAMGKEFLAKGVNVALGPGVNVHRIALNGRNAEYISGEDGYLGAPLAAAYVRGMQGSGVAAVVKHFISNEQETNRATMDAQTDERTRWEHYYPPFQAAVDAGVAAVMCSYNFVNGFQACENQQTISDELKTGMGFRGWVMSDWGALKTTGGAAAGTDQDMPGDDGLFASAALAELNPTRQNEMVERILRGVASAGVWDAGSKATCRVGCDCDALLYGDAGTRPLLEGHAALARDLARSGAVLLQNEPLEPGSEERTLPLRKGSVVAVLGPACAVEHKSASMVGDWIVGDYYVVGGSGRVLARSAASVLQGLRGRGLQLREVPNDDLTAASAVLQGADVAVVCGGAATAETTDRGTLQLDQAQYIDSVLQLAAATSVPTVVVALAPGAVLLPWRGAAQALLLLFLSGQETGNAVGDLLMGDVSPSGKLPVTIPAREEDALAPCTAAACPYTERLQGGWHIYDGKEVAFPFGHGLSYTAFEYSVDRDWSFAGEDRALSIRVSNVGDRAGAEVLQLYLGFPGAGAAANATGAAALPALVLRGFQKTPVLAPGQAHSVEFLLHARDLSIWDSNVHAWRLVEGPFETIIGASSRDPHLCGRIHGKLVLRAMQTCSQRKKKTKK